MKNSHFIPRLILRHFASKKDRICLYDLQTKVFRPDVKNEKAFSQKGFYPDDIEDEFNVRCEREFAQLLNNVILSSKGKAIRLKRTEVQKIKKFLLLLILRSIHHEEWIETERHYGELMGELKLADSPLNSFKEKKIDGETPEEYWIRSLKCILDSDYGLPEEIAKDPNATEMAWRWAWTIKSGYLGFWSSKGTNVEFLVTDVGMTSENELTLGKNVAWNPVKMLTLIECANQITGEDSDSKELRGQFWMTAIRNVYFHENFMEFPISKDLMIVLINPYFKIYEMYKSHGFPLVGFERLTKLNNKSAYSSNKAFYPQKGSFLDEAVFEYKIHNLTRENCIYLNLLTLDRVDTTLGFADPKKVLTSLETYQNVLGRLNDYSDLICQIKGVGQNV